MNDLKNSKSNDTILSAKKIITKGTATNPSEYGTGEGAVVSGHPEIGGIFGTNLKINLSNKNLEKYVVSKGYAAMHTSTEQIKFYVGSSIPHVNSQMTIDGEGNVEIPTSSGSLNVNGKTILIGNVGIGGANSTDDKLKVTGNLTVTGNTNITGSATSSGGTINGAFNVNGITTLNGNVGIGGANSTNDKLKVIGNLTVTGNTNVTGSATSSGGTINGTFNVNGTTTLIGNVGVGTLTSKAQLVVGDAFGAAVSGNSGGNAVFGTNLAIKNGNNQLYTPNNHESNYGFAGMHAAWGVLKFYAQNTNTIENKNVEPIPRLTIRENGNVEIGTGTLTCNNIVTGALTVNNSTTLTGNVGIGGANTTNDKLQIAGNLKVIGNTNVTGTATSSGGTINGALNVNGTTTLNGNVGIGGANSTNDKLRVTGNLTVTGNTNVTGTATSAGGAINGAFNVIGTTTLTGNVGIGGANTTNDKLQVTGNLKVIGNTNITGTATSAGGIINGTLNVNGTTTLNGNVGISTTTPPTAKLDVNGQIKSNVGYIFPDGSVQKKAVMIEAGEIDCGKENSNTINIQLRNEFTSIAHAFCTLDFIDTGTNDGTIRINSNVTVNSNRSITVNINTWASTYINYIRAHWIVIGY